MSYRSRGRGRGSNSGPPPDDRFDHGDFRGRGKYAIPREGHQYSHGFTQHDFYSRRGVSATGVSSHGPPIFPAAGELPSRRSNTPPEYEYVTGRHIYDDANFGDRQTSDRQKTRGPFDRSSSDSQFQADGRKLPLSADTESRIERHAKNREIGFSQVASDDSSVRRGRSDDVTSDDSSVRRGRIDDDNSKHSHDKSENKSIPKSGKPQKTSLSLEELLQDERLKNVLFAGISKATAKLEQSLKGITGATSEYVASLDRDRQAKPQQKPPSSTSEYVASANRDQQAKPQQKPPSSTSEYVASANRDWQAKPQQKPPSSTDNPNMPKSILKRKTEPERVIEEEKTLSVETFSKLSALEKTLHLLRDKANMAGSSRSVKDNQRQQGAQKGALSQLISYNDSGDESESIHKSDKAKIHSQTKEDKPSTQPFWSVGTPPAVPSTALKEAETFDVQEKQYEQWRQSINRGADGKKILVKDKDLLVNALVKKQSQFNEPVISQSLLEADNNDNEELDSTVQNILHSIGFNFDLSKRMQELARRKKNQMDTLNSGIINQSASFLERSEELVMDAKAALFSKHEEADIENLIKEARASARRKSRWGDPDSAEMNRDRDKISPGHIETNTDVRGYKMRSNRESHGTRNKETIGESYKKNWGELSSEEDEWSQEKTVKTPFERSSEARSFSGENAATASRSRNLDSGDSQSAKSVSSRHSDRYWISENFIGKPEEKCFYPENNEYADKFKGGPPLPSSSLRSEEINSNLPPLKLPSQSVHVENLRVTSRANYGNDSFIEARQVIISSNSDQRMISQSPVYRGSRSPDSRTFMKRSASPITSPVSKEQRVFSEKANSFYERLLEEKDTLISQSFEPNSLPYYRSLSVRSSQAVINRVDEGRQSASERIKTTMLDDCFGIGVTRKSPEGHTSRLPFRSRSRSPGIRRSISPGRQRSISPGRRRSISPGRRRSISPGRRRSISPGRQRSISPGRRRSISPGRQRSISPGRRRSRSHSRKRSRSPGRQRSISPGRQRSRSPFRKRSRSPGRQRSRSLSRKRSISPNRKRSRSSARQRSISPSRKRSRSPGRKRSRSPGRKRSRSPGRKRSRSPGRKRSRSPGRRSRSPGRRSRSLSRRRSKSPIGQRSKSPVKQRLRYLDRRRSRSHSRSRSSERQRPRFSAKLRLGSPFRQRSHSRTFDKHESRQRFFQRIASYRGGKYQNSNSRVKPSSSKPKSQDTSSKVGPSSNKPKHQDTSSKVEPSSSKHEPQENVAVDLLNLSPEGKESHLQKHVTKQELIDQFTSDIHSAVQKLTDFSADDKTAILAKIVRMNADEKKEFLKKLTQRQDRVSALKIELQELENDHNEKIRTCKVYDNAKLSHISDLMVKLKKEMNGLNSADFSLFLSQSTVPPSSCTSYSNRRWNVVNKEVARKRKKRTKTPKGNSPVEILETQEIISDVLETHVPSDLEKAFSGTAVVGAVLSDVNGVVEDKNRLNKEKKQDSQVTSSHAPSKQNVYYEYYDGKNHWCKHCSVSCSGLEYFLRHIHTKKHFSKIENEMKPWKDNNEKKSVNRKVGVARGRRIKGAEMMLPVVGFYCSLCKVDCRDSHEAIDHVKNDSHYDKYMEFVTLNPPYEKSLLLDKTTLQTKKKQTGKATTTNLPQPVADPAPPQPVADPAPPQPASSIPLPPLPPLAPLTENAEKIQDISHAPKVKSVRKNLRISDAKSDSEDSDNNSKEKLEMGTDSLEIVGKEDDISYFKVPKLTKPSSVLPPWGAPAVGPSPSYEIEMKETKDDNNKPLDEFLTIEPVNTNTKQMRIPVMVGQKVKVADDNTKTNQMRIPVMVGQTIKVSDIPVPQQPFSTSSTSLSKPGLVYTVKSLQQVKQEEQKIIDDEKRMMGIDVDAQEEQPLLIKPVAPPVLITCTVSGASSQGESDEEPRKTNLDTLFTKVSRTVSHKTKPKNTVSSVVVDQHVLEMEQKIVDEITAKLAKEKAKILRQKQLEEQKEKKHEDELAQKTKIESDSPSSDDDESDDSSEVEGLKKATTGGLEQTQAAVLQTATTEGLEKTPTAGLKKATTEGLEETPTAGLKNATTEGLKKANAPDEFSCSGIRQLVIANEPQESAENINSVKNGGYPKEVISVVDDSTSREVIYHVTGTAKDIIHILDDGDTSIEVINISDDEDITIEVLQIQDKGSTREVIHTLDDEGTTREVIDHDKSSSSEAIPIPDEGTTREKINVQDNDTTTEKINIPDEGATREEINVQNNDTTTKKINIPDEGATREEINVQNNDTNKEKTTLAIEGTTREEINILDNEVTTREEMNILDDVGTTRHEISILDNCTTKEKSTLVIDDTTRQEINIHNNDDTSREERNILVEGTTKEKINILDECTLAIEGTTREDINIHDNDGTIIERINLVSDVSSETTSSAIPEVVALEVCSKNTVDVKEDSPVCETSLEQNCRGEIDQMRDEPTEQVEKSSSHVSGEKDVGSDQCETTEIRDECRDDAEGEKPASGSHTRSRKRKALTDNIGDDLESVFLKDSQIIGNVEGNDSIAETISGGTIVLEDLTKLSPVMSKSAKKPRRAVIEKSPVVGEEINIHDNEGSCREEINIHNDIRKEQINVLDNEGTTREEINIPDNEDTIKYVNLHHIEGKSREDSDIHDNDGSTTQEINIHDNEGTTRQKINILDNEGTTREEINILDNEDTIKYVNLHHIEGKSREDSDIHDNDGSTTQEINIHDNDGSSTQKINIHDKDGSTTQEINIHDKDGSTTQEINIHDSEGTIKEVINIFYNEAATRQEINIHDNVETTKEKIGILDEGTTKEEMNIHDNEVTTREEINILDDAVTTREKINILDDVVTTREEINILDDVGSTIQEISILDNDITKEKSTLVIDDTTRQEINIHNNDDTSREERNILDEGTTKEKMNILDECTLAIEGTTREEINIHDNDGTIIERINLVTDVSSETTSSAIPEVVALEVCSKNTVDVKEDSPVCETSLEQNCRGEIDQMRDEPTEQVEKSSSHVSGEKDVGSDQCETTEIIDECRDDAEGEKPASGSHTRSRKRKALTDNIGDDLESVFLKDSQIIGNVEGNDSIAETISGGTIVLEDLTKLSPVMSKSAKKPRRAVVEKSPVVGRMTRSRAKTQLVDLQDVKENTTQSPTGQMEDDNVEHQDCNMSHLSEQEHVGESGTPCPVVCPVVRLEQENVGEPGTPCPVVRLEQENVGESGTPCPVVRLEVNVSGSSLPDNLEQSNSNMFTLSDQQSNISVTVMDKTETPDCQMNQSSLDSEIEGTSLISFPVQSALHSLQSQRLKISSTFINVDEHDSIITADTPSNQVFGDSFMSGKQSESEAVLRQHYSSQSRDPPMSGVVGDVEESADTMTVSVSEIDNQNMELESLPTAGLSLGLDEDEDTIDFSVDDMKDKMKSADD